MSAALQQVPSKRHEVSDDLESAFQILRWCAIKYFPHTVSGLPAAVTRLLAHFDQYDRPPESNPHNKTPRGAIEKFMAVSEGLPILGLNEQHPFTTMLFELGKLFADHYEELGLRPSRQIPRNIVPDPEPIPVLSPAERYYREFGRGRAEKTQNTKHDSQEAVHAAIDHVAFVTAPPATSRNYTFPSNIGPTPSTSGVFNHEKFLLIMEHALFESPRKRLWAQRDEMPKNNSTAQTTSIESTG